MTDVHEIERQLRAAEDRLNKVISSTHRWGEYDEYHAANEEVLLLERRLAAAKGEEYAEPFGFPLRWTAGAPMPHLMVNDNRALLAFLLSEPDPNWDGSYAIVKSPRDSRPEPLGLVEFDLCISARLGDPNDEVFEGHPLNGRGLEAYGAQRVVNSRLIRELEAINRVHRQYRPEGWRDFTHFIFWFHDSTFECVARSYKVETHRASMRALLAVMIERLLA